MRPAYTRGECGIDRPLATTAPLGTSMRMPPPPFSPRQPLDVFVSPRAVTYFGLPSTTTNPFKWQRSSGVKAVMNGGRQRGTKLYSGARVKGHEEGGVAVKDI